MIALAFALAAALLQPPAAPERSGGPQMSRTIDKGDQSSVEEKKQVLVRTEAEWAQLWQQHSPQRARPVVDFSKEMVVGVFMGTRPNAGFSTNVISATDANGTLLVRYTESVPAPGRVSAQIITFPFHLVAMPRATVTDAKFEKVEK